VRDVLGAVGGAVVDDDDFPVEVAGGGGESGQWVLGWKRGGGIVLLGEGLVEEPDDDGEVSTLIVGREED
jgi:hypothetical protein